MNRLGPASVVGITLFFLTNAVPQARAQQGIDQQQIETLLRATTRLVEVDVVAVDRDGRPVTDLTSKEFTVTENGKPQKISTFVVHSSEDDAKKKKAGPLLQPHVTSNRPDLRQADAPAVVLLLDGLNTAGSDQVQVRQQMLRYLADHFDS